MVCNAIMFCISVFCAVRTHKNNERLNRTARNCSYYEQDDEVVLTLSDGSSVCMTFGSSAVRIYDVHRHTEAVFEILLFVREYGEEQGYQVPRKNTELIGEYRLHAVLYGMGYKREQTGDLDWDYMRDERWYVNAVSRVIGRCGL